MRPTIVTRFDSMKDGFLAKAARRLRRQWEQSSVPTDGNELRQLDLDIWAIDKALGMHTDKTAKGHWVIGLVLVNDLNLVLNAGDMIHDIRPGTVYTLDGRRAHGALAHNRVVPAGLFGFMAWDIPVDEDLDEIVASIPDSMAAYAAGIERVKVA